MGIVKNQGIPSAVIIYFGVIIAFINGAILFPRTVGEEVFGFTQWIMAVLAIFSLFGDLSTSKIIVKYLPYFKEPDSEHNGFILTLFILCSLGVTMAICLMFLLENNIVNRFASEKSLNLVKDNYYLIFYGIIFYVYNSFFTAYSRAIFRTRIPTLFAEFYGKIFNSILLLLFMFSIININQFLIMYIVKFGLQLVSLILYLKWLDSPFLSAKIKIPKIGKKLKKELLEYGGTSFLLGSSAVLTRKLDILMISSFIGFEQTGIYSIIMYMTIVLTIPYNTLKGILGPLVADAWKANDLNSLSKLYKQSSINSSIIASALFLLLVINSAHIFKIVGEKFIGHDWTLYYLCTSALFFCLCGVNGLILNYSKHFKYDLVLKFLLVIITIITNYLFIPIWGIKGAAIATMISIISNHGIITGLVYYKIGIHPFSKKTILLIVLLIASFSINYFLPNIDYFILDAIVRSIIISSFFLIMTYQLELSEEINSSVNDIFEKIINR